MARVISIAIAIMATLGLLLLPAMRGSELTAAAHGLLSPILLLISACFAHGVGYVPRMRILRASLHPILLWPLIGVLSWAFARQLCVS